jgi:signal transduction histidine kinase
MHQAIRTQTVQSGEFVTSRQRYFEAIYNPFTDLDGKQKVIILFRDVTEKKEEMALAARTEQLAILGELAAGIAHEINNPINGIINYAQVLSDISEKGSRTGDIADRIRKEGDRIAGIVDGLLSFARCNKQDKVYVSLRNILSDSLTLTAAHLRRDSILVKTNIQDDLPQIMAYPQEIEQVFLNLIANARHALNKKFRRPNESKVLEITAETKVGEEKPCIRISFRDNGIGIPKNMIDKIWKPFFTTKDESKRTGLGLSISHNIVAGHGGKMVIESEDGAYTAVHIDLPLP